MPSGGVPWEHRPVTRRYLKEASRPLNVADPEVGRRVAELLVALKAGGEAAAASLAAEFDGWSGPIEVTADEIASATGSLPSTVIDDIAFAHRHIRDFARAQRDSMAEFSVELSPGLVAGQRLVPVEVAGCYVPAGRFAHVASALMSVTTASVAGVDQVFVASPARPDRGGVHPAILHASHLAGADRVLGLGGVQGIGALAYGLFTGRPADVIVGPGNSLVAEAKRQLFGRVGIDVVAGPTESMVVADGTADPATVATDLIGQAEHGPDSPVWLVTTSTDLAAEVLRLAQVHAEDLPDPAQSSAVAAWRDHGEVIVVESRDEAAAVCDEYAPEHLQVMAADPDWWRARLRNYGSLFLGELTNVTFGDKTSGPNHILPTGRAARYSGGLNVHRFVKQLTWQEMTPEAAAAHAPVAARISRLEGMEGHARSADLRVARPTDDAVDPSESVLPMPDLPMVDLDFTGQPPIPEAGVRRANELMASGRLFRYGETGARELDVAGLEADFAALVGRRYCVAFNSCGASLAAALMAIGIERDEPVLMNAFTLAPVPGAVVHAGGSPVFVGVTPDYRIDLDDLEAAADRSGARVLMLSHMRGHVPDMDRLAEVTTALGLTVVEDCAHTMGAAWRGRPTGTFGTVGCFSTQSFKHVNSGEGGLLVTDDEDVAARAVLLSGSYMLYAQHGAAPDASVVERHRLTTPNLSMRMSALAAAVVRPQLVKLPARAATWNARYGVLADLLGADPRIRIPDRPDGEEAAPSSIQFSVTGPDGGSPDPVLMAAWLDVAATHGVHVKWFGRDEPVGFTSRYDHWRYVDEQVLHATSAVLAGLCDLRIPLTMTDGHCRDVAAVIRGALDATG